jgi:hypothetical protein
MGNAGTDNAGSEIPELPRAVRGKRPDFLGNPNDELALSMIMVLGQEVCALRTRLDVVLRVAADKQLMLASEVEGFKADEAFLRGQEEWRQAFFARLFYLLHQMAAEAKTGDSGERYEAVLREIAAS